MIRKYLCVLAVLLSAQIFAQEGTNATGGDATGFGGSVSYTVGQLDYLVSDDSLSGGDSLRLSGPPVGTASQGVQHAEVRTPAPEVNTNSFVEITTGPNPAVSFIDVSIVNYTGVSVVYVLHDATGKVVLNGSSSETQFKIDTSEIASGNYLLRFYSANTEIKNQTIVISK